MASIRINKTGVSAEVNNGGSGIPIREPIAVVANYLYDATAAFSEETDTRNTGVLTAAELFGFKNNMQLTIFLNAGSSIPEAATGKIQYGLYFPSDEWVRPGTSTPSNIYDYDDLVWSVTGANFYNSHGASVVAGNAKTDRYPNHGQEMYDLTNGGIGWDFVSGVAGANGGDEFFDMIEYYRATFMVVKFGKHLSSASYRFGQDGCKQMLLPYFLGIRNSDFPEIGTNGKTDYGKSNENLEYLGLPQQVATRLDKISAASTVRYSDMAGTGLQRNTYVQEQVALTIANKGFYNSFIHWHSESNYDTLDGYWNIVNTAIGLNFVWRCSYGEAVEYLFLRELVSSITAREEGSTIIVELEIDDKFDALTSGGFSQATPQSLITVPLSIKVNLTNTSLEGLDITSSVGTIRKISDDNFVIQVPFTPNVGFPDVTITSTEEPDYLNFDLPVITNSSNNGTTLSVTTGVPTKAVLFKVAAGGVQKNSVVQARSNTFTTTHNFDITGVTGQDFRVGIISETNQSILSGII